MTNPLFEKFQEVKDKEGTLALVECRLNVLSILKKALKTNQGFIVEAISRDFGHRAKQETLLGEFFPLYQEIDFIQKHLKSWLKPQSHYADIWYQPAKLRTYLQALGTVGIIAPWNFPLILSISPLIAAIAAGNSCLLKISEYTPQFGVLLEKIIKEHLSEYGIAIINGGVNIAEAFTALPFDHLLFTGAPEIGKKVMEKASMNLTPVTLELGGKSPAIIDNDIDIQVAANAILRGKLFNAGQICVAPDYVLIPQHRLDDFVHAAKIAARNLYPTWDGNPDVSHIIHEKHRDRLQALLEDALSQGAQMIPLYSSTADHRETIQPALLTQVSDNMRIMQEEIFGPLLPIKTVASVDQGIAYIQMHPHPLTIYGFTRDKALQARIVKETLSGSVSFNQVLCQIVQNCQPFGGVGQSGFGQYRGRFGVETFSKRKPVYYQGKCMPSRLLSPPYGRVFSWMMRWMLR